MRVAKRLVSNTIYLFLSWFSISVLNFTYWILIGKNLPPASYGIVATGMQIIMLLSGLSVLGMTNALNKLIPELLTKNKKAQAQGSINYALKITTTLSLIFAVSLFLLSPVLSSRLKLPATALRIVSVTVVFFSLANLTGTVYYGLQDMKGLFLTNFFRQAMKVTVAGILILLAFDYLGPLTAVLVASLLTFLVRLPKCRIHHESSVNKKLIFSYALPAFTVTILSLIYNNTGLILLNSLKSSAQSGLYGLAAMLSGAVSAIPNVLTSALFPITSSLSAFQAKKRQSYLIKLVFRYAFFIALPIAFLWSYFAKYLILFFSKPAYLPATQLVPLLVVSNIFYGLGLLFLSSLYAIGKPKHYRNVYAVTVAVYLLTAPVLVHYYAAKGLATAMIISNFVLFLSAFSVLRKFLSIELNLKDLGKITFSALLAFALLLLVRPYIHNFYLAFVAVLLDALIYLLILLKLNFYLKEDLKILKIVYEKTGWNFLAKFIAWFSNYTKRSYTTDKA